MPTGKVHWYLCGKKSWNLHCKLYDRKCPLDLPHGGVDWHKLHYDIRLEISAIEKPSTPAGCEKSARLYLETMEPHFAELFSYYPSTLESEFRRCWTAHLIADIACPFWVYGNEYPCPDNGYGHIKDNDFWRFLTEVGKRILFDDE